MLKLRPEIQIYLSREPVDMRRSIDGLSGMVQERFNQHPQCGHVFIFVNRGRDKAKILWWDRNGFVLYYKRMEKHRFVVPGVDKTEELTLTETQLNGLLAGLDFMLMGQFDELEYDKFF
jgi:transposase